MYVAPRATKQRTVEVGTGGTRRHAMSTVHDHVDSSHRGGARRDRRTHGRLLAAVALGALLALFAVLNSQSVRIHWIVTTTDVPMIVVIVGCGLIGALVTWLVMRRRQKSN